VGRERESESERERERERERESGSEGRMRVVVDGVFAGYVPVIGDYSNNLDYNEMKIV